MVYQNNVKNEKTPLILLHGVYFDHHLWDFQVEAIQNRRVITIDMPWHGESINDIPKKWTLDDCGEMLIDIMNSLEIQKVIAVGHSWGSITILRAAHKHPDRFTSMGLCNMPFEQQSKRQRCAFKLQHTMLIFRKFYLKRAGKTIFTQSSLQTNPELMNKLLRPMSRLKNQTIKSIDKQVILDANDSTSLIHQLTIPAKALKGQQDYVPTPPLPTTIVKGGHVSPLETPMEVLTFISEIITSEIKPSN